MKKVPDKSSTEIRPGISEQIKSGTSASLRELREAVPAAVTETHARNCDSGEIRTEDYSVRRIDGKIGSCGLQPCTVSWPERIKVRTFRESCGYITGPRDGVRTPNKCNRWRLGIGLRRGRE